MDSLFDRLQALGFQHKKFPDGWFWFVNPSDETELLGLSTAMGFTESCIEDIPETIILQLNGSGNEWQYVYGADYGSIPAHEALSIIENLEKSRIVFSHPAEGEV